MNSISIVLRLIFCMAMVHWGGLKSADFLMIKLCDEDEGANLYWVVVSSILRFSSLFGEMIQFDYYFSDGLNPPTVVYCCQIYFELLISFQIMSRFKMYRGS